MPRRVLVIESAGSSLLADLQSVMGWDGDTVWRLSAWADVCGQSVAECCDDLLLALAVPEPREAARVFGWLREQARRAVAFAVLPAGCSAQLLREAAQAVDDFVLWPGCLEEIRFRLARLVPSSCREETRRDVPESAASHRLIGRDPAFVELVRKLACVATADVPVLLSGETGTGKEMCVRAIHDLSDRRHGPFIPVDCGALPDTLLESELFGHIRGAFTDAHREQRGLVAMAAGGSLFLDEVDTLSAGAQATLLRVLEEGTYRPLGAERFLRANARIISATNLDLDRAVREGRFRADLFYRLAGVHLHVPLLRDRRQDVELLAQHFLDVHQQRTGSARKTLTKEALAKLLRYEWPGNVRELSHVVQGAVIFSTAQQIAPDDIVLPVTVEPGVAPTLRAARDRVVGRFEQRYLEELLRRWNGNLTHASRAAGLDRRALGRLVRKHSLDPRTFH